MRRKRLRNQRQCDAARPARQPSDTDPPDAGKAKGGERKGTNMSEQKPPQYPHPGFGKPGVKWTGDLEGVSYFRRGSGDNLECDYMDGDSTASAWTPVNEVDSLSSTTVRCTAARLAREDEAREAADRESVVEVMNASEMQQCLEAAER